MKRLRADWWALNIPTLTTQMILNCVNSKKEKLGQGLNALLVELPLLLCSILIHHPWQRIVTRCRHPRIMLGMHFHTSKPIFIKNYLSLQFIGIFSLTMQLPHLKKHKVDNCFGLFILHGLQLQGF